jgi:hypothetical protein
MRLARANLSLDSRQCRGGRPRRANEKRSASPVASAPRGRRPVSVTPSNGWRPAGPTHAAMLWPRPCVISGMGCHGARPPSTHPGVSYCPTSKVARSFRPANRNLAMIARDSEPSRPHPPALRRHRVPRILHVNPNHPGSERKHRWRENRQPDDGPCGASAS